MTRKIYSNADNSIFFINSQDQAGTYILRIILRDPKDVVFGRFKNGKTIPLESGQYLYIGSALSQKGATTLGNRIQRHMDRSGDKPEHRIRSVYRDFCDNVGITYAENASDKTLFWNIDHLTDLITTEIIGVIAIRSPQRLENTWSEFIEERDDTEVFEKGLGANDNEGHTHLQKTTISDDDWLSLPERLPIKPEYK